MELWAHYEKAVFFQIEKGRFYCYTDFKSDNNYPKVRWKMEKYITLKELSMMTGLTTRTLRNYMKIHILQGKKLDGVWKFRLEDVGVFFSDPSVKASIRAKRNAVVYDYLHDNHKTGNEICSILDFCVDNQEAERISEFFCNASNLFTEDGKLSFHYEKSGQYVRVILRGSAERVMKVLNSYYSDC